jgi:hypothetical protein
MTQVRYGAGTTSMSEHRTTSPLVGSNKDQPMRNKTSDKVVSRGWHYTYGWLRRREEDRPYGFCYEDGDGDLIYTPNPRHRDKIYLECREDNKTGERYLCFSTTNW